MRSPASVANIGLGLNIVSIGYVSLSLLAVSPESEFSLSQVRSPVSTATLSVSPASQVRSPASLNFATLAVSPWRELALS